MPESQTAKEIVLVVDDDQLIRSGLKWTLSSTYQVLEASTSEDALPLLQRENIDVVVTDLHLPPDRDNIAEGLNIIRAARELERAIPVVVITASSSKDAALEAVKHGAYGFFQKPFDGNEVLHVVNQAARMRRLELENLRLREELPSTRGFAHLLGGSQSLERIVRQARAVALTSATVLLIGENGTGKEMLARAIHEASLRSREPFIAVSCAALPESLIESELFGHEKGSFTSAMYSRKGRFELADQGTLFLDEIAELTPNVQVKLLRVLQERSFEKVGGSRTLNVDIRLIAASNRDLEKEVEAGRFRRDLFYRLNVVPLVIPPLRSRREDVPILAAHFAAKFAEKYEREKPHLDQSLLEALDEYDWPGNVRELENLMERLVVLGNGPLITAEFLPDRMLRVLPETNVEDEGTLEGAVTATRQRAITNALESCGGNKVAAAKRLGISRSYLHRLINELDIN
jgi:DNA-binding NtrC family response regulator